MPKSSLNFIWVGPLPKGGAHAISATSIAENFKNFNVPEAGRNPMVFWCQAEHQQKFVEYFAKENIKIEVKSIEPYLESIVKQSNEQDTKLKVEAAKLLEIHSELLLGEGRNSIHDRVTFKDVFALFLMANEGGYFLDTNLEASQKGAIHFPEYDEYKFPWLEQIVEKKLIRNIPEVWMQYSPYHNTARAKESLLRYLESYPILQSLYRENNIDEYHKACGIKIARAVCLAKDDNELYSVIKERSAQNIWRTDFLDREAKMQQFALTKVYFNSHFPNQKSSYTHWHYNVLFGPTFRLKYGLMHDIDPNTKASPRESSHPGLGYEADDETLLHSAFRYIQYESCYEAATLLLSYAANPNAIYTFKKEGTEKRYTALRHVLEKKHEKGLNLLLDHNVDLKIITDNKSPLMIAAEHEFGVAELLAKGADPNQEWPNQQETPLSLALAKGSYRLVKMLLDYDANLEQLGYKEVENDSVQKRSLDDFNLSEDILNLISNFSQRNRLSN